MSTNKIRGTPVTSFDMDDVLFPFLNPLIDSLNKKHCLNINPEYIYGWNIENYVPLTKQQIFEPIHNDKFWKLLKPNDDALWLVDKLKSEGYKIKVITASFYQNIAPKMERLFECFPIKWEDVIVTSNKQCVATDVLIDDGIHNLIGGKYHKILKDMPHNRQFDVTKHNIKRVFNLYEAYEYIKEIFKNT